MELMGITGVAAITVIAYLLGEVAKASRLDNKWIPIICGVAGGLLGLLGMAVMPVFPAEDVITALAVGIVSGLAATGADQIRKQMKE
ncbi:MAG: phage holin family protein [Candidatus Limivicinus sp.]